MNVDFKNNIENLKKATKKLQEFSQKAQPSELERAGIIQAFEFCFELFWKTFQKIAENEGSFVGGPKPALQGAFKRGLFMDDGIWLKMLQDRNLTVHTYNDSLANDIYQRIVGGYVKEFSATLISIQTYLSKNKP